MQDMNDEASPHNVLLVDDDPGVIQVLSQALQGLGTLRFATRGATALKLAAKAPPDLMLLDAEMPGMSGLEVLDAMRADPLLAQVPVIFITSRGEDEMEERCLALGAVDFIAKPVRPTIVAARVRTQLRLKAALDDLQRLAATDSLTGCANRRVLEDVLSREWRRAWRTQRPLTVMMVDVDHFKKYNDRYGHPAGDAVLSRVAAVLRAAAKRSVDLVARYGGEEFVLVLPDTDAAGAEALAQGILAQLSAAAVPHEDGLKGQVSVSIGAAPFDPANPERSVTSFQPAGLETSPKELVALADKALYAAKQAGRARYAFAKTGGPSCL